MLLKHGVDVNAKDGHHGSALIAASESGHTATVQALLDAGAYVDPERGKLGILLYVSCVNGDKDEVRQLIAEGAGINVKRGEFGSPLMVASRRGHTEVVKMLLNQGADVNMNGGQDGSALMAASKRGHTEVMRMLIEQGAGVNAKGGIRGSALAAVHNRIELVKILLRSGVAVSEPDRSGDMVLGQAVDRGDAEVVRLLQSHGAEVCDIYGRTPLHRALARRLQERIMHASWLTYGCSGYDCYGRNALDWALSMGANDVQDHLRQALDETSYEDQQQLRARSLRLLGDAIYNPYFNHQPLIFLGRCLLLLGDLAAAYVVLAESLRLASSEMPKGRNEKWYISCDGCSLVDKVKKLNKSGKLFFFKFLELGRRGQGGSHSLPGRLIACVASGQNARGGTKIKGADPGRAQRAACPETDLCSKCLEKYQEGHYLRLCTDHKFWRVPETVGSMSEGEIASEEEVGLEEEGASKEGGNVDWGNGYRHSMKNFQLRIQVDRRN